MRESKSVQVPPDSVAAFCSDLYVPLKVVSSLVNLAADDTIGSQESKDYLEIASQRLQTMSNVVSTHCDPDCTHK
jgi:hypothetical protein